MAIPKPRAAQASRPRVWSSLPTAPRKLLGNLFELEDLGGKDLKGIDGPERVWAVLRANPVDSRFDAFHATGVTELVGRQEELELLLRRWTKAVGGGRSMVS